MNPYQAFRFPEDRQKDRERIRGLAWLSIGLLTSTALAVAATLGQSQAMKTAWASDLLAIVPPISLLFAMRVELREPTERFPYGYTRAISIAFLTTAAALSLIGVLLLGDALLTLVRGDRPPIGTMVLFGHQFWAGWPMIAALAYSVGVGMLLGHLKSPIAERLADRELAAEAKMNRDGWTSEGAAILGLVLVGYGFWWGDAASAALISINIVRDGWDCVKRVLADLMDESPNLLEEKQLEDLPHRVRAAVEGYDWVERAAVRLREHGRLITGDIFIVPRDAHDLAARIERAAQELATVDWRLHALTMTPVATLERSTPARHS
jgi:divalent metal cation (Fe/Co/Zn/Cd) transporter